MGEVSTTRECKQRGGNTNKVGLYNYLIRGIFLSALCGKFLVFFVSSFLLYFFSTCKKKKKVGMAKFSGKLLRHYR